MRKLVLIGTLTIFLLLAGVIWVSWNNFVNEPNSQVSEEVIYEVAPGLSFRAVAKDLQNKGLIKNADLFVLLAKLRGGANKMKVGEYALNRNMKPSEVLAQILSGKSIERSLTVSEGLSMFEVAEIFEQVGLGKYADVLAPEQLWSAQGIQISRRKRLDYFRGPDLGLAAPPRFFPAGRTDAARVHGDPPRFYGSEQRLF